MLVRGNAIHAICNCIELGNKNIVLECERNNPKILLSLIQGLVNHQKSVNLLEIIIDSIDLLFELDISYPVHKDIILPITQRFLDQDGLAILIETQKHPNY